MTAEVSATTQTPAQIVTRVIAFFIDVLVLAFISFIAGLLIPGSDFGAAFLRGLAGTAVTFAYFGYGWTAWRASPGQRVLGLRTVKEDGTTLTWNDAVLRWAYLFGPSAVASLLGGIGVLSGILGLAALGYAIYLLYTAANDSRKQGFHDKQAHTLVVQSMP